MDGPSCALPRNAARATRRQVPLSPSSPSTPSTGSIDALDRYDRPNAFDAIDATDRTDTIDVDRRDRSIGCLTRSTAIDAIDRSGTIDVERRDRSLEGIAGIDVDRGDRRDRTIERDRTIGWDRRDRPTSIDRRSPRCPLATIAKARAVQRQSVDRLTSERRSIDLRASIDRSIRSRNRGVCPSPSEKVPNAPPLSRARGAWRRTSARALEDDGDTIMELHPHPTIPQKKPVLVCILDGWGENEYEDEHNAVHVAKTPTMDALKGERSIVLSHRPGARYGRGPTHRCGHGELRSRAQRPGRGAR